MSQSDTRICYTPITIDCTTDNRKEKEYSLETHIGLIDYDKAFDLVNRTKLWEIMYRQGYTKHLIIVIQGLYQANRIVINTGRKNCTYKNY